MVTDDQIINWRRQGKGYRWIMKQGVSSGRVSKLSHNARKLSKYVVFNDTHVPFEDKDVMELLFGFIARSKPDGLIILGDFTDFYQVSRFAKDPARKDTLQDDIDKSSQYLWTLRRLMKRRPIYYLEGNHEERLEKYLRNKSPEFYTLRCLAVQRLLRLDEFDIVYRRRLDMGEITFIHGEMVRRHAGYSAKGHYDRYGTTMMHGHTHRDAKYTIRTLDGNKAVWENYCTCSLYPEYDSFPNWTQGFSVVTFDGDTPFVEQIPIINGRYVYGGKVLDKTSTLINK